MLAVISYDTVTAMIAPALFLTASGSLVISTSGRIGRIVDRIRNLVATCDTMGRNPEAYDFPEERRKHIMEQLHHLEQRSKRAKIAVTLLYLAFASFSATSMAIGLDSITGQHLVVLPIILAICGVGLLLGACIHLVIEARAALLSNDMEVRFFLELDELRNRREGTPMGK